MDFSFPQEQIELADALGRWMQKNHDLSTRRSALATGSGIVWNSLSSLGVTSLLVGSDHEGYGGDATDLFLVMRELGRALAVSPFWSTAVAAKALEWGGTAQARQLLGGVAAGEVRMALALGEADSRHELNLVQTRLTRMQHGTSANTWQLDGGKHVVLLGAQVDYFLVSASIEEQVRLVLVAADAPGIESKHYKTLDGHDAVDLRFSATPVQESFFLDAVSGGGPLLERVADYGASLLCAEAVGLMELAKDSTLEYLKTRQQFGSPLSKFQALQHRMVDIMIQLEQGRSMAYLAVAHSCSEDVLLRVRSVAAAKSLVGEAARFVGQQCVQLHGAIGLTDACPVSHVLKRITMIDLTLGDSDHHLERFSNLAFH